MIIYGNSQWPTVRWLRKTLADVQDPPALAWGINRPNALGGSQKLYGLAQLEALQAANIPTPRFWANYEDVPPDIFAVGRITHHSQGRKVRLPTSRYFTTSDYFVEWLPSTAEWRVWATPNRTFANAKKVFVEEGTPPPRPIRSRRLGWHLHFEKPPKGVRPLGKRAVAALGYDFGAVDILQTTEDNLIVLEVNSAFALRSPFTRKRFLATLLTGDPNSELPPEVRRDYATL